MPRRLPSTSAFWADMRLGSVSPEQIYGTNSANVCIGSTGLHAPFAGMAHFHVSVLVYTYISTPTVVKSDVSMGTFYFQIFL